jgi:putative ABC transport system permease protein
MNFQRLYFNFAIGLESMLNNRLRTFLTSLGIIFGVAAVISMLSIGAGAEKEILEQMKQVGANNIMIKARVKTSEEIKKEAEENQIRKFSPGLSMKDVDNIFQTIPAVEKISPEIEMETSFIANGIKKSGKLIGVTNSYFDIANLELSAGNKFSDWQMETSSPVCIIGKNIKTTFFPAVNPIGKMIKCGNVWLQIVGVLEEKGINEASASKLSIRNSNQDIYTPIFTFLLRFRNRGAVTKASLAKAEEDKNENRESKDLNYHQLDRVVVHIKESDYIQPSTEIISRLLQRRHNHVEDFEILVPELLLKQEQKTKKIFNAVLGVIASISLLVGGIGIMNIMLASVLERIKEIGLRMSLGATKKDIVLQFLSEAMTISFAGGVAGVLFGIALSYIIEQLMDIKTIVSVFSVVISFSISISIGLLFGIMPAKRASEQDPVNSLRYE